MKEENTRPVLSISLLCSGRNKEEMIGCLNSLMTIRQRIPSEIVIVDTGCGSDTKLLLNDYADKVVEFTWCDDFAKARNAGLKECSGEWFMFIDDDEQFENTDGIIDFFNSVLYKKYDKAEYIIRNFKSSEKTVYADVWLPRIVKHVEGLHFHGKIHEFLSPVGDNSYKIKCVADHSGYEFPSRLELFKKAQRNIPPLLEMMKSEPDMGIWRSQLIQEYRNINDYNSMEKLSLSTLEEIHESVSQNARLKAMMYEGVLFSEIETFQFDKAVANLKTFLSDDDNSEKCVAGLCFYAVKLYLAKKDYRNTYNHAQRYLEIYKKISSTEDTSVDDLTFVLGNIFAKERVQYCIAAIISSGVRVGNISVLYDYFDMYDLSIHDESAVIFSEGMNYAFTHFGFEKKFVILAEKMCKDEIIRALLLNEVRKTEKNDSRHFDKLVQVYGMMDSTDDIYILYLRVIYAYRFDKSRLMDMYKLVFECVLDFFDMGTAIWEIADKAEIDLVPVFINIPFVRWKKAVDLLMDEHYEDRQKTVLFISEKTAYDNDIRFEYFRLKIEEKDLSGFDGKESATVLLNRYCSDCVNFYLNIYKAELFTGDTTILPQDCQFAIQYIKIVSAEQSYSPIEFIKALEKCAAIFNPFSEIMKSYISEYGERKKAELQNSI